MAVLDKKQVNFIHDLLLDHGVTYEALQIDLLDHICCMVEEKMDNDLNFDESLSLSIKNFGLQNLAEIQETTIYLLTLKVQKMKKLTGILGIIASLFLIIGVFFKFMHWPGAGMAITFCVGCIGLIVLPLMTYMDLSNLKTKNERATVIIGYISGILLSFAVLFKINHWPGAWILFNVVLVLIIFVFVPIYTIKNYKNSENKLLSIAKSMLIIAGSLLFWALIFLR